MKMMMLVKLVVATLVCWSQAQQYVNDEQSGRQGRIYVCSTNACTFVFAHAASHGTKRSKWPPFANIFFRRCDGVDRTAQLALVWSTLDKQV